MGNIADALDKAGVGLADQSVMLPDEMGSTISEKEIVEEHAPDIESAEPVSYSGSTSEVSEWDERIDMIASRTSHASEAFRILRSKILFPQEGDTRIKTIMIASSAPSEGKSFVAVNLAIALAKGVDQHSLLVDCDLRRPSLADLLGLKSVCRQGLSNYLREGGDISGLITRTALDKLSLLPSGDVPLNPAELLTSSRMNQLVTELSNRYADRHIIFDSPPFQVASEAAVLAQKVDKVVLVVGYGKSDRSRVKSMVDAIGPKKIVGVVFNALPENMLKQKMFDPYGTYGEYYTPVENT